jgi:AcrR family transcriptional regulator
MKTKITPKDKLLQTAIRLFYEEGYRAIGVDTIAAESGIGKMTLYRHFPSKDDLLLAYLKDRNEGFWNNFEQVTQDAPTAREKLLAFFEFLQNFVQSPMCHGCPFLNLATEYPEKAYVGHQLAIEHKQSVRVRFRQLAKEAGAMKPDILADQLFLLMDGTFMSSRMFGEKNPATHVAEAARILIDAALE